MVTTEDGYPGQMQEELLTAVIWALLADGVPPDILRAAFEHSMITAEPVASEFDALRWDETGDEIVN